MAISTLTVKESLLSLMGIRGLDLPLEQVAVIPVHLHPVQAVRVIRALDRPATQAVLIRDLPV